MNTSITIIVATIALVPLVVTAIDLKEPSCGETPRYCGGAHGDPSEELSCTSFPASFDVDANQMGCNHKDLSLLTAGNSYGAKAWHDSKKTDHFWVFHGCDGAGTMDDVCGQTGYVELLGPYSSESVPLTMHECEGGWKTHCSQPFVHPGSGKVYEYYWAGMMTWGGGSWPDEIGVNGVPKPWWSNMGLPDTSDLGNEEEGVGFVIIYPWVCGQYGEDLAWLWGNHKPYGDETYQTKCYYDNEPWNNDHWSGTTIPPIWQAYKFVADGHKVKGWLLAEKKGDSPDPLYYIGEDNSFTLRSMHGKHGPWTNLKEE